MMTKKELLAWADTVQGEAQGMTGCYGPGADYYRRQREIVGKVILRVLKDTPAAVLKEAMAAERWERMDYLQEAGDDDEW